MWLFFSRSFLAIVDKGDDTGQTLLVRARRKGDIERVFPFAEVVEGVGTDYKFRARVPREEVAERIAESVRNINYANFKDTVHEKQRHDAHMGVWSEMYRFQQGKR